MEREHSTVSEAGKKGGPKKFDGAAAYNTKFDSKWCSKYPVEVSSSQTYFVYSSGI
jgi:hypothetical protein